MNQLPALRHRRRLPWLAVLAATFLVVACGGAPGSPAPTPGPTPSPTPGEGSLTREQAIAKVLASDPRFVGIGPVDPNLIGQSAWYEVSPAAVGWRVTVTIGWGDCPAGCINRHAWVFDVDGRGSVTLIEEFGDPLEGATGGGDGGGAVPPLAIPAEGGPWIAGRALAGPTCPVAQVPPDPACADRPVAGAAVVIRDTDGARVAEVITAVDGSFLAAVPGPGRYVVEAQPVEGLMGTPAPFEVVVPAGAGSWAPADLGYNTGIL
jgi:hypothetical protein